jgi:CheY-like chemotaxis protein
MGGKLKVESEPGAGSTFSFELTFETVDASSDTPEYSETALIEKPLFDGLILICEDNPMNQQVINEHLSRVGLRTVVAENGKIGVDMVKERILSGQKPYDLIFMDIFMPVMVGGEAASEITGLNTGIPIVAMTANVMISELDNYKKHGMQDCVGKPFTTQELWRCLLKYLTPLSVSEVDETEQNRGEDELLMKLRVKFFKDNRNKYSEIAEALSADDLTLTHRLAHSLKGNAKQIGENALGNIAAEIESLLGEQKVPPAEMMNELETELMSVLDTLEQSFEGCASPGAAKNEDAAKVLALFEKLELMLKNINPECVSLLGEIRAVPGTEELTAQIEDYDFAAAADTLAKIMNEWE